MAPAADAELQRWAPPIDSASADRAARLGAVPMESAGVDVVIPVFGGSSTSLGWCRA